MPAPLEERLDDLENFLMRLPQDTMAYQETVQEVRGELKDIEEMCAGCETNLVPPQYLCTNALCAHRKQERS